jgi:hypothetical protein
MTRSGLGLAQSRLNLFSNGSLDLTGNSNLILSFSKSWNQQPSLFRGERDSLRRRCIGPRGRAWAEWDNTRIRAQCYQSRIWPNLGGLEGTL